VTDSTELSVDAVIRIIAETAVEQRASWDRLDSAAADGDFGTTMSRGFRAVLAAWAQMDQSSPRALLTSVSGVLSQEMGGSSGPLISVGFLRAGIALAEHGVTPKGVVAALQNAAEGISHHGGAAVGDKTLLDALVPATEALAEAVARGETSVAGLATVAAIAAETGARSTTHIKARRGRAAYAGERSVGAVDPGAAAVAIMFARVARALGADGFALPTFDVDVEGPAKNEADNDDSPSHPSTKQFVNDPDDAVAESLAGYALAHSDLVTWDASSGILRQPDPKPGRVGLVAGGGSGHEPMHGGFTGPGMLTAVAPGLVFASPTVHQVLAATLAADTGRGVVHIVKNYTGDVINFGIAAELAAERGVTVQTVIIDDDVGLDETSHDVGRRGTGATVLVEKIAGAAAYRGGPIESVVEVAQRAVEQSASFGIALGSCSPPGRTPILSLGSDEIEIGVGIHGEPGRRRGTIQTAAALVDEAAAVILERLDPSPGSPFLAFVSGLGATTLMEQYIVYGELERCVAAADHRIARQLVGPYLTALNMPGVLITLMALDRELIELWDAPVHTAALRWGK
jgi:dihydroxyacetone kinase phosphoprotein-dependent L subunit